MRVSSDVPEVLLSLAEVARRLDVPRLRLTEWVRLGLLGVTPFQLGMRRSGRVGAYAFPESALPRLAKRVARLKGVGLRVRGVPGGRGSGSGAKRARAKPRSG